MNELEIIEKAKDIAKRGIDPNEDIEIINMQEIMQNLLNLYQKKSRMVEIMAEHLTTDIHDKNWVMKYFEDEVELENEEEQR